MLPNDPSEPAAPGDSGTPRAADAVSAEADGPRSAPPSGYDVRTGPVSSGAAPRSRRRRIPALGFAIALVAILGGSALFMAGFSLGRHDLSQPGTPAADDKAFEPFWNSYHTIIDRFAGGPVDKTKLIQGAIKGMIAALDDPYSSYLTPEEFQQTLQGISGQFEGIGAEIGTQNAAGTTTDCATLGTDCRLVVISPIEGSPAAKAGLRAGDVVISVDGSSVDGLTVDAARNRIRGKKGTSVVITVTRKGDPNAVRLTITRDVIVQKEVITKDLAGGIGYIRLTGFSDNGASELHTALAADIAAGKTKIVLDLRGNPGGFVTAARSVASEFLGSGTIFWQQDAQGRRTPTDAKPGGAATDPKIKVVVLIDKGSASASEIVAGALQDTHRATLVGETSFGKGTVQEWTTLEGAGGFKLTIARWLTPNQRWIHHVGLVPDVKVAIPAQPKPNEDPVLDKAVQVLGGTASSFGLSFDRAA